MLVSELLLEGANLMLLGMGIVFGFLIMLVFVLRGMSLLAGRLVKVDHGNGVVTVYAHLQEARVEKGQQVGRLPAPLYQIQAPYFKNPPGWAKGKKTGWKGAPMPPGQGSLWKNRALF